MPWSMARTACSPISPRASIIAVSSTTSPFVVQEIAAAAKPKGIGVLDAPICRGRFAADEGTLLALVGGEPDVVERGRAVYSSFCSDYAHLGNVGHGQVGKTMNNLLLWVNAVGLIEAGRLAETTGIDLVKLRDALMMSSGSSDALKEWDMISFTWALKDMQVVAEMTDKAGLSLPVTGAIKELVKEARRIKATNPPNWTGKGPTKYSDRSFAVLVGWAKGALAPLPTNRTRSLSRLLNGGHGAKTRLCPPYDYLRNQLPV